MSIIYVKIQWERRCQQKCQSKDLQSLSSVKVMRKVTKIVRINIFRMLEIDHRLPAISTVVFPKISKHTISYILVRTVHFVAF